MVARENERQGFYLVRDKRLSSSAKNFMERVKRLRRSQAGKPDLS